MERKEALKLLRKYIKADNLRKHSLAVEATMRRLAKHFKKDEDLWGICGLLHDIDYEKIDGDINLHSKKGAKMLEELGFGEKLCNAVLTHNEAHGIEPESLMGRALSCVDSLTGLIVAATLVLPSRKIKDLKVQNVLNRFEEKNFAKGVDRESIKKCGEYSEFSLKEFVEIVLSSMKEISDKLDL